MKKALVLLPAVTLLAGCISFGPKAPKTLLTLTTTSAVSANAVRTASPTNTILVLTPTSPVAISTVRIPVYDGASNLSYIADAAWNEAPGRAIQRILSETITARTDKIVLDPRQFSVSASMKLSGQLQRFGVDPGAMQVVVVFDAQLSRSADKVETRRFEARAPLSVIDGGNAGAALNAAANDLATQVAAWVG
ncbi:MAG: ABC-type transport auxiliary lipoprotein family protein [Sphingomonadales bacterium]